MKHPVARAFVYALLALLAWAVISAIASAIFAGLPQKGESLGAYNARISPIVTTIDLIVGGFVLFLFGWLIGRSYPGRDAIRAAALLAVFYIAVEFLAAYLFSGGNSLDVEASLVAYADKIAAALLGGWLGGRRPASDPIDAPPGGMLDTE